METDALETLEHLAVLRLQPGDRLVVKCDSRLSQDHLTTIAAIFRERIPDHEVIVLDAGMDLAVLRSGD